MCLASSGGCLVLLCPNILGFLSLCRMARACLNLMAAVVSQGPEAARDVCSHFDLNKKTLYTLVTKRDSKVRTQVLCAPLCVSLLFGELWYFSSPCLSLQALREGCPLEAASLRL